jgi:RecB family exonuclease
MFDNLRFDVDGVSFLLRGTIDRVERGADERIPGSGSYVAAVDYKTSKWSTPASGKPAGWDDGVVLQVPLYAKALEKLEPGAVPARIEYRAINQRESVHCLQLYQYDKKARAVTESPEDSDRLDSALSAAATAVRRARAADFPARYAESCKCPSFCAAWDICRVKGGPQDPFGW